MKATGVIRKIDNLGRIVIPMELRRVNGWEPGTPMEMFSSEEGLFIKKYSSNNEKQHVIDKLVEILGVSIDPKVLKVVEEAIDYIEEN